MVVLSGPDFRMWSDDIIHAATVGWSHPLLLLWRYSCSILSAFFASFNFVCSTENLTVINSFLLTFFFRRHCSPFPIYPFFFPSLELKNPEAMGVIGRNEGPLYEDSEDALCKDFKILQSRSFIVHFKRILIQSGELHSV